MERALAMTPSPLLRYTTVMVEIRERGEEPIRTGATRGQDARDRVCVILKVPREMNGVSSREPCQPNCFPV